MYEYTKKDQFFNPLNYQYSKVYDEFLDDYLRNRKEFLKKVDNLESNIYVEICSMNEILTLQKRFEVKKRFCDEYDKNVKEILFFSYNIFVNMKKEFCFSLFSTFLKVNDYLLSLKDYKFNIHELVLLKKIITYEVEVVKDLR